VKASGALLAETRRRPGRVLLTGLAIIVATVFAAGTLLFTDTLDAYVATKTVQTPAAAAVVVTPPAGSAGLVRTIGSVDGTAAAVGVWSTYLPVDGGVTWSISSDPMGGPLTRLAAPVTGRLPAAADEMAVATGTAERLRLVPGATVEVGPDGGPVRRFTVTAIVRVPSESLNTAFATPAAVEGLGGQLDGIDVAAAPGVAPATLVDRVSAVVGPEVRVRTGAEQRAAEAKQASASVAAVLVGIGVFAGLALVAAAVVVASTFRIVLTQRRTQLALLRCVGATRGQITRAVLAEGAVTGLVAGLVGVGAAVGIGFAVLAAMRAIGIDDVPALVVSAPKLGAALLVAVGTTLLAAIGPALAASRIPPVAALGTAGAGEAGAPRPGRRLVAAGVLTALAVGIGALALATGSAPGVIALAASGMVAFAALVVAGPVLVRVLAATVGRVVVALGGTPGRLAVANAREVPRRTAATIAVLALGVGLTSALLVAMASTRAGATASLDREFPADIVVDAPDVSDLAARLGGDPRLVVRVEKGLVLVDAAPGVPEHGVRAAVTAAVAGRPGVLVRYAADARAQLESTIDTVALVGLGLVGMTALVAVVGVGVTLALSVAERTRETGLLRAVGLTRSGVRAMVAWEAALSGAGAALVGAVLGGGYGLVGVQVLGLDGLAVPVGTLLALVAGVVLVAVLAAVAPAARAGRVPPIRALVDA
jgi:putative ABC transport system permease protein